MFVLLQKDDNILNKRVDKYIRSVRDDEIFGLILKTVQVHTSSQWGILSQFKIAKKRIVILQSMGQEHKYTRQLPLNKIFDLTYSAAMFKTKNHNKREHMSITQIEKKNPNKTHVKLQLHYFSSCHWIYKKHIIKRLKTSWAVREPQQIQVNVACMHIKQRAPHHRETKITSIIIITVQTNGSVQTA